MKGSNLDPVYIGARHGEKLYEVLVTQEEMIRAEDLGEFFRIPADNRNLNYDKYIDKGNKEIELVDSYNSHNAVRLDVEGMKKLLLRLEAFRKMGRHKS